jgi:hypothetical protein
MPRRPTDGSPVVALALGLSAAACSGACGKGSSGSGAATTSTAARTTFPVILATGTGAKPKPPVLELVAATHPGIKVAWSERAPCDAVQGENETMIVPYPSQASPPGPPTFTVPGSTTSYVDTTPSQNILHTYHVRCVTAGVASDWSNELAANPMQ